MASFRPSSENGFVPSYDRAATHKVDWSWMATNAGFTTTKIFPQARCGLSPFAPDLVWDLPIAGRLGLAGATIITAILAAMVSRRARRSSDENRGF
jgi:hypothetical protein